MQMYIYKVKKLMDNMNVRGGGGGDDELFVGNQNLNIQIIKRHTMGK